MRRVTGTGSFGSVFEGFLGGSRGLGGLRAGLGVMRRGIGRGVRAVWGFGVLGGAGVPGVDGKSRREVVGLVFESMTPMMDFWKNIGGLEGVGCFFFF